MPSVATALRPRLRSAERVDSGVPGRGSLVRRLAVAADARLVVVVAPPGYGKSTLLGDWAAFDQRRFVWLTRSELRTHELRPSPVESIRSVLPALRASDRASVLVLDDAHLVDAEALREAVSEAMLELPAGSALALASRTEPPLPLGRLRASGTLIEVRVDDLALTPAEAATLLRRVGVELDFGAVQTLVQRTEGWPVALYLASMTVREEEDADTAVQHVRGDDHHLAQYFRDEVLSGLSHSQTEFAVRTSVLGELSGGVCDSVLNARGSGAVLSELEQASPLLRPIDPAHERYRWHSLIRDALQAELRRADRDLAPTLHARASSWFGARGDTEGAISHAVRAHDCVLSGNLLWAAVVQYISQGRNSLVRDWLAEFSHAELVGHPRLGLAAAYSFVAAGDVARARQLAVAVAAVIERQADDTGVGSLGAGLAALHALLGSAGVAGMTEAAGRACSLEPRDSPRRPLYVFLYASALYLGGRSAIAERLLEETADLSAASAPVVMSMCLAQAAMIAIEAQDWEMADDLADRAWNGIQAFGLSDNPVCALVFAASAASRAHVGRADEAKEDLRRAIDLLATLGDFIPWYGAEARVLLARASLGLADVVGARTLLAEASRLARRAHGAVIFQRWFDAAWSQMDTLAEENLAGPSSLTIAELRVLRFLPSHRSFREIAAQLGVSANTVKTQAHAVYRKLGAASRSEAVARALDAGLLGQ